MQIVLANDHAACPMREPILKALEEDGHEVRDCGVALEDSVDYPDMAERAVQTWRETGADRIVLMCGSGLGISISANKCRGVRCALCTDEYAADMARRHNDANAVALRGREMDPAANVRILRAFLATEFEGGRHQRRVDKIAALEAREGAARS